MKGLIVWASSYCRSTLGFYKGLGISLHIPLKIIVLEGLPEDRKKTGFCDNEFKDLDISIYPGIKDAEKTLIQYKDYYHIFAAYSSLSVVALIKRAIANGIKFGIGSEAPCNMTPPPKRILKYIYMHTLLPFKVRPVVKHADFIINYSGDNTPAMIRNGWDKRRVIPCGYYPPAIQGSKCVHRGRQHWENFTILLSGIHQWHRSPMVLLYALRELDKRGLKYKCIITQKGPLYEKLKKYINIHKLEKVKMLGFLPLQELIQNYESCSIYVGAGNNEPWGMRLNDALLCGAPLIINRGMGGCKLVDDYNCGENFDKGNYLQLANILERLIKDYDYYQKIADNAYMAAQLILPEKKAEEIVIELKERGLLKV